jgi:hypothetical protein
LEVGYFYGKFLRISLLKEENFEQNIKYIKDYIYQILDLYILDPISRGAVAKLLKNNEFKLRRIW